MYIPHLLVLSFLNVSLVSAYLSSGWSPAGTNTAAQPGSTPSISTAGDGNAVPTAATGFDWTVLLKQGPIAEVFKLAGVNITERLDAARKKAAEAPYDTRIPLITDDNYDEIKTTTKGDDTWFIVVTLGTSGDPLSKLVDDEFDKAYNTSLVGKDLPHIKWGRIDYMTVTRVTTEWMVWKAPVLVVARSSFRELRFLYPNQVALSAPKMHKFLKNSEWTEVPVWTGAFSPEGKYSNIVKSYAHFAEKSYTTINKVPKWLFLVASGSIASFIISLMHSAKGEATSAKPGIKDKKSNGVPVPVTVEDDQTASGEKKPRTKRFLVKKASEAHPELAGSMTASMLSEGMTSSMISESEGLASDGAGGKRPDAARRRSTRTRVKK